MRPSGRAPDALRDVSLEPGVARHAEGSCLIRMGATEVLCTASVEGRVPPFLRGKGQGWVTAEYGMLPRATHTRGEREAARGKQSGRTQEIQRLIGRSLARRDGPRGHGRDDGHARLRRAHRPMAAPAAPPSPAPGWRCTWPSATACAEHHEPPCRCATRSRRCPAGCGTGTPVLDLDYDEDSKAETDANFVLTGAGGLVEVQGTAEGAPFSEAQLLELLRLARRARTSSSPRSGGRPGWNDAVRWPERRAAPRSGSAGRYGHPPPPAGAGPHRPRQPQRRQAAGGGGAARAARLRGRLRRASSACPSRWRAPAASSAMRGIKALAAARATGLPALADDSGFSAAALGGDPGVRTADWAMRRTAGATTRRRWRRSRSAQGGDAAADRRAWFTCALVPRLAGRPHGGLRRPSAWRWIWPPRGERGFGYDPMFVPEGHARDLRRDGAGR